MPEEAGGISIGITGDWSDLQTDFQQATSAAESAGDDIASAFYNAANAADQTGAAFESMASSADTYTAGAVEMGDVTEHVGEKAEEAGHKAHESESLWGELFDKLKEGAAELGLAIGLWETLKEAVEVDAEIQKVDIALTHLTGSAAAANEIIEQMEKLAKDDAIAFPELLPAAQRMVAVGIALEDIAPLMDGAAQASWALGTSLEAVTGKLDGMILSGMASARQLRSLGLSSDDMAKVMGVSAAEVAKAFKDLDVNTRAEVMEAALKKFSGTAQAESQGISGKWVELKNTWHEVMAALGKDLEPVTEFLMTTATLATKAAGGFLDMLTHMKEGVMVLLDPTRLLHDDLGALGQKAKEAGHETEAAGAEMKTAAVSAQDLAQKVHEQVAAHNAAAAAAAASKKMHEELTNTMREFLKAFDTKAMTEFDGQLLKNTEHIDTINLKLKQIPLDIFQQLSLGMNPLESSLYGFNEGLVATQSEFRKLKQESDAAWKPIQADIEAALHNSDIAANQLGITLSRVTNQAARDAKTNFQAIAHDGASSAQDIQNAYAAMERAQTAASSKMVQDWRAAGTAIENVIEADLSRALQDVIFNTKNVGQAFAQLGKDVVGIILDVLIKEGIDALIAKLITSKAITGALNMAQVASDAAVAAAGAYAATAIIPFIGPALAPAAAAEAYAATMAFAPLASFDVGGFVPGDMIAQVHKGEFVLTEAQVSGRAPVPSFGNGSAPNVTINVMANKNPRETARELMLHLKALSPKFSPAS